ncbi:MAG: hypothetical protein H0X24_04890, partial [Ktedonobacterales bacterium]|nr:hypothetical protein [Ktedonobacterales bacterium]
MHLEDLLTNKRSRLALGGLLLASFSIIWWVGADVGQVGHIGADLRAYLDGARSIA